MKDRVGRVSIDWKSLKKEFTGSRLTIGELAKRYKCSPRTIKRKAAAGKWRRQASAEEALGSAECAEAADDAAQERSSGEHRLLWHGVRKRLARGLEHADVKAGIEELKVAKMAGEVLISVMKGEMLALGLNDEAVEEADDREETSSEMASVTFSPGAGKAMDGE